jgi:putative transposase
MVELGHPELSIRGQCQLLGLPRSSYYHQPTGESPLNLELMRRIDEQFLATPFYGVPQMTAYLRRAGYQVNPKRIRRLMRRMGLEAIYPRPRTTIPSTDHKIYPYLLRGLSIAKSDQVWCADITYVPMPRGYLYLVAIMDWFSRYVIAWRLSNTLDAEFCLDALDQALAGGRPSIFNTDQGVQFTSDAFTGRLQKAEVAISMDGRGRFMDNIFIERLWRTVKYEEIYLHDYESVFALEAGLERYFEFYNTDRPHKSLAYRTPAEVYQKGRFAARLPVADPPYSC